MMQAYIEKLYNYYLWTLTFTDPRTKGWLLIESPLPTLYLTGIYLLIVWIGPMIMEIRKPYKLTSALIIYNFGLAILNLYIFTEYLTASRRLNYSYVCELHRPTDNRPDELRIVNATWWYYFSKVIEFMDTFFFILRKKDTQLTFLHVYHHCTMFPLWWIGAKWVPSGASFSSAMINSLVHIIMYSYYGLSAMGPAVSKYLWWKKYLTLLQLLQFLVVFGMTFNSILANCEFPKWMLYSLCTYMIVFLFLFQRFYVKAYKQTRNEAICDQKQDVKEEVVYNKSKEEVIKSKMRVKSG